MHVLWQRFSYKWFLLYSELTSITVDLVLLARESSCAVIFIERIKESISLIALRLLMLHYHNCELALRVYLMPKSRVTVMFHKM